MRFGVCAVVLVLLVGVGLGGTLGCESSGGTTPQYRPNNPPPPPDRMPRVIESNSIHRLSSELSEEYLRRLQEGDAEAESERSGQEEERSETPEPD